MGFIWQLRSIMNEGIGNGGINHQQPWLDYTVLRSPSVFPPTRAVTPLMLQIDTFLEKSFHHESPQWMKTLKLVFKGFLVIGQFQQRPFPVQIIIIASHICHLSQQHSSKGHVSVHVLDFSAFSKHILLVDKGRHLLFTRMKPSYGIVLIF